MYSSIIISNNGKGAETIHKIYIDMIKVNSYGGLQIYNMEIKSTL